MGVGSFNVSLNYLFLQGSQASAAFSLSVDVRSKDERNQVEERN